MYECHIQCNEQKRGSLEMFKVKGSLRKSDYWSVTGHMLTIALWVKLTWKQRETLMMQSLKNSSFICMAHGISYLNMMHFVYNVVYISLHKRCDWIQICRTCSLAYQLTFEWETEKKDCEKCIFWTSYVLFLVVFTVSAEKRETETQINSKRHLYEVRYSQEANDVLCEPGSNQLLRVVLKQITFYTFILCPIIVNVTYVIILASKTLFFSLIL